ncbi:MAG TPA: 50S ribosomal protein L23 [Candidatus Saccharimonadales bacterium]|nr:50S ribosomal protein L23 [Candidatus Saccharimonadales bacterium]
MELKIIPHISEKTYAQSLNNVYVFKVPATANKQIVADAVAKQYDVKVEDVKIIIAKGKVKTSYRGGKPVKGQRRDIKKAYVRLAEGSKIAMFEQEETK